MVLLFINGSRILFLKFVVDAKKKIDKLTWREYKFNTPFFPNNSLTRINHSVILDLFTEFLLKTNSTRDELWVNQFHGTLVNIKTVRDNRAQSMSFAPWPD